jgi:hypothetical protein
MHNIENAFFSEKEYEFAYSFEFMNKHKHFRDLSFTMPNLRQEATSPYDTRFDWESEGIMYSKFFQYKIPKYVLTPRRNDIDIRNIINIPYYTYEIRKRSKSQQHTLLYFLSKGGEDVSYVSPLFHHKVDLFKNFKDSKIHQNSILFDPKDMPMVYDDRKHSISYNKAGIIGVFKSTAKQIPIKKTDDLKNHSDAQQLTKDYIKQLYEKLVKGIKDTLTFDPTETIPDKIAASLFFSCIYLISEYYEAKWILYGD